MPHVQVTGHAGERLPRLRGVTRAPSRTRQRVRLRRCLSISRRGQRDHRSMAFNLSGSEVLEQLEYRSPTPTRASRQRPCAACGHSPHRLAVEGTPAHLHVHRGQRCGPPGRGQFKLQYAVTTTVPWSNLNWRPPSAGVTWCEALQQPQWIADGTTLSTNQLTSG